MSIRDYLAGREEELLAEMIDRLQQIEALKAELIPIEGELAEVRRAKVAIGMSPPSEGLAKFAAVEGLAQGLSDPSSTFGSLGYAAISALDTAMKKADDAATKALADVALQSLPSPFASPYEHLTMKNLVKKALWEQFRGGATTRQLLDFFRDAWSRNVERTSLSPQLSRLFQDGEIGRIRSTRGWFFIHEARIQGFKPYFDRNQVYWKERRSTTIRDEPCLTRDIDGLDDRMPYMRTTTTNVGDLSTSARS